MQNSSKASFRLHFLYNQKVNVQTKKQYKTQLLHWILQKKKKIVKPYETAENEHVSWSTQEAFCLLDSLTVKATKNEFYF